MKVINRIELVKNGQTPHIRKCRSLAIKCLEHVVNAVDPQQMVRRAVKVENGFLTVENKTFDLNKFKHVYVLGGGKASGAMAKAIEEILGKHLTAGIVNVPYGAPRTTRLIKINEVRHPIPDEAGVKGTMNIMELAQQANENDLVICLISGGGSSLMPLPRPGVSLEDKQAITSLLLKSGAPIVEVNAVRKHLSDFKGGWLAKKAFPATVLNLFLSDVIGDSLEAIASGPTVPDTTTFNQAIKVLKKHNLWSAAPHSIRGILLKGSRGLIDETPKPHDAAFKKVSHIIIGNNRTATLAATDWLTRKGVSTLLLSRSLEGEAREVGQAFAKFSIEAFGCTTRIERPFAIIAGGETTVTVMGQGLGGRNQELALSVALQLYKNDDCVFASFSTDGVDGPTDAAGAIADTYTMQRAEILGLNALDSLKMNDSYHFFLGLGDLIITKATGTNVNDILVFVG